MVKENVWRFMQRQTCLLCSADNSMSVYRHDKTCSTILATDSAHQVSQNDKLDSDTNLGIKQLENGAILSTDEILEYRKHRRFRAVNELTYLASFHYQLFCAKRYLCREN